MIKKLRIRFVIIAILSVFVVLSIIMTFTNFFNFTKIRTDADDMLVLIKEYDGRLEEYLKELEEQEKLESEKESSSESSSDSENEDESEGESESVSENIRPAPDFISKETPYETRFFIVKFGEETIINI